MTYDFTPILVILPVLFCGIWLVP